MAMSQRKGTIDVMATVVVSGDAHFDELVLDPDVVLSDRILVVNSVGISLWSRTFTTSDDGVEETLWTRQARWLPARNEPGFVPIIRRGDALDIVRTGGVGVVALDDQGFVHARLAEKSVRDALHRIRGHLGVDLGQDLGIGLPVPQRRGDYISAISVGDEPVVAVSPEGRVALRLDKASMQAVAAEIVLPGGRYETPDVVASLDAWDVRRDGDILRFTANYWGNHPRAYVKRGSGDPWAESISEIQVRLLYGDELADAPLSHCPDHFAHILVPNDGHGQEGLNGEVTEAEADDIDRSGKGFAAMAADSWLRASKRAKPWIGARSEAVLGADLDELAEGQALYNLARACTQFRQAVAPYSKRSSVQAVSLLQGAADGRPDYKAALLRLSRRIVTETGTRQINLYQPAGTAFEGRPTSVFGTVDAYRERGEIPLVLVSPIYPMRRRSGSMLQPDPVGMTMLAELDGLAGPDWLPPLAFYAELHRNNIAVDFEIMDGCSLVAPSFGLTFIEAETGRSIEVVDSEVTADPITLEPTRLLVTLAEQPVGGGVLRYAYDNLQPIFDLSGSTFCNGGDMRDSWSHPSITGETLHRYAFSFEFNLRGYQHAED
ncbi:hypothetical protein [Paracoccus marcusii]|uniref:hypothetical protein n=1 Tax=Paracoccus marcusii TaxID=59779 RepID=UPI0024937ADC|nr:hypothetical protein [Paracoccus marcusii]